MQPLQEDFWDYCYLHNMAGWDIGMLPPAIKDYLDTIPDTHAAILIPACGRAYEAHYLAERGFDNVTILDISAVLIKELKQTFKGKPVNVLHGDFFNHEGKYDLIIEQAFFCTVPPEGRGRFINHLHGLLNDGGKYAGLFFNESVGYRDRPPFTLDIEGYRALFSEVFEITRLSLCAQSIDSRKEKEIFFEFVKKSQD